MSRGIHADKATPYAKSKSHAAPKKPTAKKSAVKKQPQTMYDLAIKNGWGPRLRVIPGSLARLKKTPA